MKREKSQLIWVIFAIALIIRILLAQPGLSHFDSVIAAQAVEGSYEDVTVLSANNGRYGYVVLNLLFYIPYHLFTGGAADMVLVFSNVLFGSLAIVIAYYFLREYFNEKTGMIGAILLTLAPLHVSLATMGKEHGVQLFFGMLVLLLLQRKIRDEFVVIAMLALVSLHEMALIAIPFFILFAFLRDYKKNWKKAVPVQLIGISLGTFVIAAFTILKEVMLDIFGPTRSGSVKFLGLLSQALPNAVLDLWQSHTIILGAAAIGAHYLYRAKDWKKGIFLGSFLLLTLFYFGNTTGYTSRYLFIVSLPLIMLASHGISCIPIKDANILYGVAILIGVISLAPFLNDFWYRSTHSIGVEYAEAFTTLEDNALVIVGDNAPFITYYGTQQIHNIPHVMDPQIQGKFLMDTKIALQNGHNVYLTKSGLAYDAAALGNIQQKMLADNFRIKEIHQFQVEDYHLATLGLELREEGIFELLLDTSIAPDSIVLPNVLMEAQQ